MFVHFSVIQNKFTTSNKKDVKWGENLSEVTSKCLCARFMCNIAGTGQHR